MNGMEAKEAGTLGRILQVAEKEFLENGFRGATLRKIVKKAGVTTGAFYGYFKSKEALFDALVKKDADFIKGIYDEILADFAQIPPDQQEQSLDKYSAMGLQRMFDYAWEHKRSFRLIAQSGSGTAYEHFLQDIVQKDIDSTERFYRILESRGTPVERVDPMVEQLVISGSFTAFFTLILKDIPREEAERGLAQLFRFYRGGWNNLMHFSGH